MRIVGYEHKEPDTTPHHVERWYDRGTRCWIVQTMNEAGDQLGDAYYCHAKVDAIAEERSINARIKAAA